MPQLVTHTPQYDAVDRVVGFASSAAAAEFKRAATYAFDANGNRTGQTVSLNGAAATSAPSTIGNGSNRQSTAAGAPAVTNAAGDLTSVTGKTIQYDTAGRVSSVTAKPVCPIGTSATNCPGTQTTTSLYNGMGQRVIRDAANSQTVYVYGQDGYSVISQVQRNLSTSAITTTEHIYLPTASGPMPVAAVIAGKQYAVHSDQLNTPRRLTDSAGAPVWQWAYSAFGEVAAQALPAAGQAAVNYELRYPGQVDDGNGLFYNFHRFYDPLVGRYTQSDPIGLAGGWNRFGYVGGNALSGVDPTGLIGYEAQKFLDRLLGPSPDTSRCVTAECAAGLLPAPSDNRTQPGDRLCAMQARLQHCSSGASSGVQCRCRRWHPRRDLGGSRQTVGLRNGVQIDGRVR